MIKKVFHVALQVRDLDQSVDFYRGVMGMEVVSFEDVPAEKTRVAFLRLGDCEIEMSCQEGSEKQQYAAGSVSHFPHLAFEVEDVSSSMKDLSRKGVRFDHEEPQLIFGNSFTYNTFKGPDGEILEISRRLPQHPQHR